MLGRTALPSLAVALGLSATTALAQPLEEPASAQAAGEEPIDFGMVESEDASTAEATEPGAHGATSAAEPVKPPPAPEPAPKPARTPKGIHIAMHLGVRLVLGDYGDGRPATVISGPGMRARTDFGYAIDPRLVLGGYIKGAYGERGSALKQLCEEDDDLLCLSTLLGLGVALHYLPLPDARLSPWARYSAGISVVYTSSDPFAPDHLVGGLSLDFAALGLGLDWNLNGFVGLGVFVELGAGTYLSGFEVHEEDSDSASVKDGALHYDLDVGLRVLFRI